MVNRAVRGEQSTLRAEETVQTRLTADRRGRFQDVGGEDSGVLLLVLLLLGGA